MPCPRDNENRPPKTTPKKISRVKKMAEPSQSTAADKLQTATLTFTNGTTSGWVLIRKKRKRFNLPGSSQWKRRYLTLNGSILATFSSEAAYEKASYIAENKHSVSIDPSCICAPSTETTEGSTFILSTPQDSATLTCLAYNRREMQQWVTAIGRAIRWSIDTNAAEQILQRHPGDGTTTTTTTSSSSSSSSTFDPNSLNSLLRRKSLNTLETSAIRQLMVSLKNDPSKMNTTEECKAIDDMQVTNPLMQGTSDNTNSSNNIWYAAFPYQSTNANEVTLGRGERVLVIDSGGSPTTSVETKGWWLVENVAKMKGRVPSGYLTQTMSEIRYDAVVSSSLEEGIRIALYTYKAESNKELSFQAGERMHIVERHANGWWLARREGKGGVGFVPSNYFVAEPMKRVDAMEEETNTTVAAAQARTRRNSHVLFDYNARSDNEITVNQGDVISIVEDDPSLEWTLIEVRGARGYIPTTYLKRLAVKTAAEKEDSATAAADSKGITANVLGWQANNKAMPTSVQGLLQKKHLNESEVARVREMMTMLSGTTTTTTPAAHAGGAQLIDLSSLDKDRVLRSTVHPGTPQDALLQERADAVPTPIMQWDQIQRNWSYGSLALKGARLMCLQDGNKGGDGKSSAAISKPVWSVCLDSYCTVEYIRNPTKLDDLANDSSDDEDESGGSGGGPPGLTSTALFCLRVAKYNNNDNEDNDGRQALVFEHIVATRSQINSDELKSNIQTVIDDAMESELDQLMIFAEDGTGATRRKSVLNTIATKARQVLSRNRDHQKAGGVSVLVVLWSLVVAHVSCVVATHSPTCFIVLLFCCVDD